MIKVNISEETDGRTAIRITRVSLLSVPLFKLKYCTTNSQIVQTLNTGNNTFKTKVIGFTNEDKN